MNKKKCMILALAVLPMLNSCSDWLDPKPLSFYSPENTYVDAAGLYAALTACERNMRHEFFGDGAPILTEMYLTDIAVHGKTDESGNWTSSLSKWLEETYKSKANITNLSQDKATVKVGLEELEKNKDKFDLAYIIFGENDQKEIKPNEFKEDYEKIIKNLKERNKNISIVSASFYETLFLFALRKTVY